MLVWQEGHVLTGAGWPRPKRGEHQRKIFFDPSKVRAGIVTCGGLYPGLNDVIRSLVRNLTYHYGVARVVGFRNGYQGFIASYRYDVVDLTPQNVRDINVDGGTVRGAM